MKSIKNIFLIYILITFGSAAHAEDKVISLTSNEFPPYHAKSLMNQGPVTELIIAAYERVGYRVVVTYFPWARGDYLARKGGKYHGVISLWYNKERGKRYLYSDPYMDNEVGFYKRKSNAITFTSYKALQEFTIGTVINYANPPGFDAANLNVKPVVTDELNIAKLCNERINLVLIDRLMAEHLISKNNNFNDNRKVAYLLIIATFPIVIAGLLGTDFIESNRNSIVSIAYMNLLFAGFLLFFYQKTLINKAYL